MHCRPTQANEHITIDPARDDPLPVRDFGPQHVHESDRLQAISTWNDVFVHEGMPDVTLLTRETHALIRFCLHQQFIVQYFEQNPLSQLGVIGTCNAQVSHGAHWPTYLRLPTLVPKHAGREAH